MSFHPQVNQELVIDGVTYCVAEHPAAPGMPYGQEGRAGIVYRLVPSSLPPAAPPPGGWGEGAALKVFKPRFRTPFLVSQAERLAAYADLPGLSVCRRTVLTPTRNVTLLRQHPDLTYAVLMPWIEGPTWMEVLLERRPFTPAEALSLARALADVLVRMEEQGVAHCDLSGPNLLLPALAGGEGVALVDVEGMYAPGLIRPEALPSGSSGYAHRSAQDGLWAAHADRFAGAILLAEMLGWGDEAVRQASWGESYFDPAEMPARSSESVPYPPRYETLLAALQRHYGAQAAALLERAWHSDALADCPTFGEWLVALPDSPLLPEGETKAATVVDITPAEGLGEAVRALMQAARRLEEQGELKGALEVCRQAQALATGESGLAWELAAIMRDLEERLRVHSISTPPPPPAPEQPSGVPDLPIDTGSPKESVVSVPRRKADWGTWGVWVLLSALGWAVARALSLELGGGWPVSGGVPGAVAGVMGGAVLGLGQWLTLRCHLRRVGWWVPASALGLAIAWGVGSTAAPGLRTLEAYFYRREIWIVGLAVGGAVLSLGQWLILRRHLRRAGWWVPASVLGWAVGWPVAKGIIGWIVDSWTTALILAGTVSGALTGAVLVWLLRQPKAEGEESGL